MRDSPAPIIDAGPYDVRWVEDGSAVRCRPTKLPELLGQPDQGRSVRIHAGNESSVSYASATHRAIQVALLSRTSG